MLWIGYAGWLVMGSRSTFPDPNLLETGTVTLAPPIGIFALGSVVVWARERFRDR
ncbi:MAG: hypothetical protein JNL04_02335 [Rhodospirillaceae bacterium]|nr:hypothetical protein [Rhodospirillaceae bacterium]